MVHFLIRKWYTFKLVYTDCKAFALTGRLAACYYTQGDALGYELLGFQPVLESHARV